MVAAVEKKVNERMEANAMDNNTPANDDKIRSYIISLMTPPNQQPPAQASAVTVPSAAAHAQAKVTLQSILKRANNSIG